MDIIELNYKRPSWRWHRLYQKHLIQHRRDMRRFHMVSVLWVCALLVLIYLMWFSNL